jgi:hypothetical protein
MFVDVFSKAWGVAVLVFWFLVAYILTGLLAGPLACWPSQGAEMLTMCDWVLPWCLWERSLASPSLPMLAAALMCEGSALLTPDMIADEG